MSSETTENRRLREVEEKIVPASWTLGKPTVLSEDEQARIDALVSASYDGLKCKVCNTEVLAEDIKPLHLEQQHPDVKL
jgi:hypothetical protein